MNTCACSGVLFISFNGSRQQLFLKITTITECTHRCYVGKDVSEQLLYIHLHQKELRVEKYINLHDDDILSS